MAGQPENTGPENAAPTAEQKADAILAQTGGQAQGGQDPSAAAQAAPTATPAPETAPSGKVVLDFNGTPREFDPQDLVKAVTSMKDLTDLQAVVDRQMQSVATAKTIDDVKSNWDPRHQELLAQVLGNPGLLDRLAQPQQQPPPPDDELDLDVRRLDAPQPPQYQQHQQVQPDRMQRIEDALQAVMGVLARNEGERREESRTDQVRKAIQDYPTIRANAQAAKFVEDQVLTRWTLDPNLDYSSAVAETSATLAQMMDGARQTAEQPVEGEGQGNLIQYEVPNRGKGFTAADMESGRSTQMAEEFLARFGA